MGGEPQQVLAGVSGLPGMGLEICNTFQLNDLCRPYRAFFVLGRFTQGVALGCHIGAPLVLAKWGQSSLLTVGGHGRAGSPPVSRCWREKGSVLTIDSWEVWRGERQQVRAGGTVGVGERCGFGAFDGRIPEGTFTARARPLRIPPTPGGSP